MLVDGHSMAFRAFFALPAENFSTSSGQCTNAVYGFLSMLSSLVEEEQPSHIAVAFDISRQTFRSEMFPEYKAQRAKTPEEFGGQVELIREVLSEMGIVTLDKDNYEADDVIATLATQACDEGFRTLIVTGDRDSLQLVNDDTTVLYPMRGVSNLHRFTPEAVEKKYGLTPAQYPDFAALRGDPSDNLPGVPGVGEKTATKWIVNYGSLAELIKHADDIGGKVGGNFRERIDAVELNRTLTEMIRDLDLPYGPGELELRPANAEGIAKFFDKVEFGSNLRDKVLRTLRAGDAGFAEAAPSDTATEVQVVQLSDGQLGAWLADDDASGSGDSELSAIDIDGEVMAIARLAADEDSVAHVVVLHTDELSPDDDKALGDWLADADKPKALHDAKTAMHALQAGPDYALAGVVHDTLLASYLLQPSQRSYGLSDVIQRHLDRSIDANATGQIDLLDQDGPSGERAVAVLDLVAAVTEALDEAGLYSVYADIEVPLMPVLAEMESVGIAVDVGQLENLRDEFTTKLADAEQSARDLVDQPGLNIGSPKQLQEVLFEQLDMPKTKKTKTGYSTAAKELEWLAKSSPHPFLEKVLQYREFQKMKSTVEGLLKAVGEDGRIHTTFNQVATATGRLSSTSPNLQNIPVRNDVGRAIRRAFVPGDGYATLVTADYSQIEMRVMAHLSEDEGLIEAYRKGEDLHDYVGAKVFEVPIDGVTPDLRRRVKAMSYGLAYGLSAYGLSQQLDIPAGEAKKLMDDYFTRFGGVRDYLQAVVEQARKDGYTATLYDRRRYLPELNSTNRIARENAERAALNSPIQGTAADIIKVAMLRVDDALKRGGAAADEAVRQPLKSRVLLQVHDELVVEVAKGEEDIVIELLRREMDAAIDLRVPLDISVGSGQNWDAAAH
ncbi:DNA polymerase I [Corynebacterium sp. TAE3-ERU12]|nr:DNA polymerase I [Corynebacterium sp. TAE3-ERU12]